MGLRIATNIPSVSAQRTMRSQTTKMTRTLGQLASGDRITETAIDPSGLAISEKLKAGIRSQSQSIRNSNDAISLFQVAEGALNEISGIGVRLRELAVAAASDTYSNSEREMMSYEFKNLKDEVERISRSTDFNGQHLLDGNGKTYDFQVGIQNRGENRISFNTGKLNASLGSLGISGTSINTKHSSQRALGEVDTMIDRINKQRSILGSKSKRLVHASANSEVARMNSAASNSRIRDVDVAEASARKVSLDINSKATVASLAQANSTPEQAMKLIA